MQAQGTPADAVESYVNMLKLHNSKVAKVIKGYCSYAAMRERSKTEGIPFQVLQEEQNKLAADAGEEPVRPRKFKKKKIEIGVEIVVKDKNGEIITFDDKKAESDHSCNEDTEITAKGSRIESEDTL